MRMGLSRLAGGLCAAACAALVAGSIVPVQAATGAAVPGWRQVYSKHYGVAANNSSFGTVVATSKDNAWALGGSDLSGGNGTKPQAVAAHWNGHGWSDVALPAGVPDDIDAASAPASNDIWAVTHLGGYILHWNGSHWSIAKRLKAGSALLPPQLTGVVALSATNVWVFGASGDTGGFGTWHYNGKAWSEWRRDAVNISVGSAVSATSIWAIGGLSAPQSAIVHFINGTWHLVSASALSGLQFGGIQAFSNTNIWVSASAATGSTVVSYLLHYNGKWTRYKLPWSVLTTQHLASDGQGGLWLTTLSPSSGQTYAVHRTAKGAWARTSTFAIGQAGVLDLAHIPGTSSLWAVGLKAGKTNTSAVIWADGTI